MIKMIITGIALTAILSFANVHAAETKVVTGTQAKDLYQALIQADLPATETDTGFNIQVKDLKCSIANGGAFGDDVDRGQCSTVLGNIPTSAAAIAIADALIKVGVDEEGGMSHVRPSAESVVCESAETDSEPYHAYKCTITGDFSQE